MDPYGPGLELKQEFEKNCDCTVEYVDAGGAKMAMERMKLDPTRRVDLILGLDHILLSSFAQTIKFQQLSAPDVPLREELRPFIYPRFIPYDWSPMGFVYRKGEVPVVSSWQEAFEQWPDRTLSLQDPELSAPGLEWLYWLYLQPKELTKNFVQLNRIAHSVSPSWSASYGFFRKGQVQAAFTYLTSLIYHWSEEKNEAYQFMQFKEGHPVQIEYAAVPDSCWNCGSAKKFVSFLLTEKAQKILAAKNYMLPVRNDVQLPEVYTKLPNVKILGPGRLDEFVGRQDEILDLWRKARR